MDTCWLRIPHNGNYWSYWGFHLFSFSLDKQSKPLSLVIVIQSRINNHYKPSESWLALNWHQNLALYYFFIGDVKGGTQQVSQEGLSEWSCWMEIINPCSSNQDLAHSKSMLSNVRVFQNGVRLLKHVLLACISRAPSHEPELLTSFQVIPDPGKRCGGCSLCSVCSFLHSEDLWVHVRMGETQLKNRCSFGDYEPQNPIFLRSMQQQRCFAESESCSILHCFHHWESSWTFPEWEFVPLQCSWPSGTILH